MATSDESRQTQLLAKTEPEFEHYIYLGGEDHNQKAMQHLDHALKKLSLTQMALNIAMRPDADADHLIGDDASISPPDEFKWVPNEVWTVLMEHMVMKDVRILIQFAGTCRWAFLLSTDQRIWKKLCFRLFSSLDISVWSTLFAEDWHRMYVERPRIRCDGVYISTFHYLRFGFLYICCY